ncbi:HNH endonuclease [Buttiauxella brennerae]|uniref:HNH endonuclease n=1 Tax=Buttiauxella brennerae TaxID=82988 RepID=UPI0007E2F6AF|nr:HNH endonuclease [Buttiauxella brennerae]
MANKSDRAWLPTRAEILSRYYYDNDLGQLGWINGKKAGKKAGWMRQDGYIDVSICGEKFRAHRLIYFLHHNIWPIEIDHINGVRDDNHIENLRETTSAKNQYNIKMPARNTSGVRGVCWHKASRKWYVQYGVGNKKAYLGTFQDLELAELVANEYREKYHGEYYRDYR